MHIACLGDSNTYGYDPASPFGGRYPYEIRWTGRLENEGVGVTNHGYNGLPASRRSLHEMFAQDLKREGPFDLVTLMLGTNDILLGSSAYEAAEDVEHLVQTLKKASVSPILLIAPPPLVPGFWVESREQIERSQALAGELRTVSERQGVRFADAGLWGIQLAYDGVHFSEEGHCIFAEKLLEKILRFAQDDRPDAQDDRPDAQDDKVGCSG